MSTLTTEDDDFLSPSRNPLVLSGGELAALLEGNTEAISDGLDEFTISRLIRGIRAEQADVARLEAYVDSVVAAVKAKTDVINASIEKRRLVLKDWLERNGKTVNFPDLGTFYVSKKTSVSYDEPKIMDWLANEGAEFKSAVIKTQTVEKFDKTAFKKLVEAERLEVPGFTQTPESSLNLKFN